MIGGQLPQPRLLEEPARSGDLVFENLRHELRRGGLPLAVLAALRTEQHGYGLRPALADNGIRIEQGTLYPLLRRLETCGLLSSERRQDGKRTKRFYKLTTYGRRMLEQLLAEWKRVDLCLSGILGRP